ncbi:hypothetical protein B0H15DRAFT_852865 [Mycena belliarum]|uniref:BTB domain-containing protein n=1 Tax=Mycena belliarum TaxID=1033014 RepID=A0AAD6TZ11_9AGAR|nr:hypothetical protein B0H15DRAFT_852865 [Mycena belliae]
MESSIVTRSVLRAARKSGSGEGLELLSPALSTKRKLEAPEPTIDAGPSSSKRTKSASQTFAKHSRFWALDGNVVLQFGAVAFKLHRSRLSTQSVWFEKLFERRAGRVEPLEADEENIADVVVDDLDSCDVYDLQPLASMEDFEALLTAMEDAIEFCYNGPRFLTASAILRAATTFKFSKFQAFARTYLLGQFSADIGNLTAIPVPNPTAAILLGRKWNLPGILKRAFYELLRSAPHDPDDEEEDEHGTAPAHRLEGLAVSDVIRLADAQKHLAAAWLAILPSGAQADGCPAKATCGAQKHGVRWAVLGGRDDLLQTFQRDPLRGIDALCKVRWAKMYGFCTTCAEEQKAALAARKEELWDEMDRWFAIPVESDDEGEGDTA